MAKKKVKASVKFRLPAGAATAAPPVGSSLGQHQVNLMDFVKKFNGMTADKKGTTLPVEVTVYIDKTFDIRVKGKSTTDEIKDRIKLTKGSKTPGKASCGTISRKVIEEIAKVKMADLSAFSLDSAVKTVEGSARSFGLEIVD